MNMDKDIEQRLNKTEAALNEILNYIRTEKYEKNKKTSLINEFAEINTRDTFMKVKANTFPIEKYYFHLLNLIKKQ